MTDLCNSDVCSRRPNPSHDCHLLHIYQHQHCWQRVDIIHSAQKKVYFLAITRGVNGPERTRTAFQLAFLPPECHSCSVLTCYQNVVQPTKRKSAWAFRISKLLMGTHMHTPANAAMHSRLSTDCHCSRRQGFTPTPQKKLPRTNCMKMLAKNCVHTAWKCDKRRMVAGLWRWS